MKVFVKRNKCDVFEKAQIEIDNVTDLTTIEVSLMIYLKQANESIDYWNEQVEQGHIEHEIHLKDWLTRKANIERVYQALDNKNEITM